MSKNGVFLVGIFPHLDWIRGFTSPNTVKYRPEKLRIWTLFTRFGRHLIVLRHTLKAYILLCFLLKKNDFEFTQLVSPSQFSICDKRLFSKGFFCCLKRFEGMAHPPFTLHRTSRTCNIARTSDIHKSIRNWLCLLDCRFSNLQDCKKGFFCFCVYLNRIVPVFKTILVFKLI